MPPKSKPKLTVVRTLVQDSVGAIRWVGHPKPDWYPSNTVAYGWSDGSVTWTMDGM